MVRLSDQTIRRVNSDTNDLCLAQFLRSGVELGPKGLETVGPLHCCGEKSKPWTERKLRTSAVHSGSFVTAGCSLGMQ